MRIGGGGVDGHRSIPLRTTNLSGEINCFFMRARATKERAQVVSRPSAGRGKNRDMNPYFRRPLAVDGRGRAGRPLPGPSLPGPSLPATSICNSTKVSQEKIVRRLSSVGSGRWVCLKWDSGGAFPLPLSLSLSLSPPFIASNREEN